MTFHTIPWHSWPLINSLASYGTICKEFLWLTLYWWESLVTILHLILTFNWKFCGFGLIYLCFLHTLIVVVLNFGIPFRRELRFNRSLIKILRAIFIQNQRCDVYSWCRRDLIYSICKCFVHFCSLICVSTRARSIFLTKFLKYSEFILFLSIQNSLLFLTLLSYYWIFKAFWNINASYLYLRHLRKNRIFQSLFLQSVSTVIEILICICVVHS